MVTFGMGKTGKYTRTTTEPTKNSGIKKLNEIFNEIKKLQKNYKMRVGRFYDFGVR